MLFAIFLFLIFPILIYSQNESQTSDSSVDTEFTSFENIQSNTSIIDERNITATDTFSMVIDHIEAYKIKDWEIEDPTIVYKIAFYNVNNELLTFNHLYADIKLESDFEDQFRILVNEDYRLCEGSCVIDSDHINLVDGVWQLTCQLEPAFTSVIQIYLGEDNHLGTLELISPQIEEPVVVEAGFNDTPPPTMPIIQQTPPAFINENERNYYFKLITSINYELYFYNLVNQLVITSSQVQEPDEQQMETRSSGREQPVFVPQIINSIPERNSYLPPMDYQESNQAACIIFNSNISGINPLDYQTEEEIRSKFEYPQE